MLILLSPAKKLDFESEVTRADFTQPCFLKEAKALAKVAKQQTASDLKKLMHISDNLAELNVARFKAFKAPFTLANARQAIDAFKGDVYQGLDAPTLSDAAIEFAQEHVRILSGLYGLLRPLDLMQAYRLEMGVRLQNPEGATLYQFWGDKISKQLNKEQKNDESPVVVNLASNEYFKSVDTKKLKARIITPVFKEIKGDNPAKIISFMAKKARGLMTRYIIENAIEDVDELKNFTEQGYAFQDSSSTENQWVFSRKITS